MTDQSPEFEPSVASSIDTAVDTPFDYEEAQLLIKQELAALGLERFWYLQRYEHQTLLAQLPDEAREVERVAASA